MALKWAMAGGGPRHCCIVVYITVYVCSDSE